MESPISSSTSQESSGQHRNIDDVIDLIVNPTKITQYPWATRVMKKIHFGKSLETIVPQDFHRFESQSSINLEFNGTYSENNMNLARNCLTDDELIFDSFAVQTKPKFTILRGNSKKISKKEYQQKPKSRQVWSREEDDLVIRLIKVYGKRWSLLSIKMENRTGKQIRDRYLNKLDPTIKQL
jgi:hypothetical protein